MSPEIFIQLLARNHEMARSSALAVLKDVLARHATLDDIPRTRAEAIEVVEACVDEIDSESLRSAITALETDGFVFRNVDGEEGLPRLLGSLGISDWLQIYVGENEVHFNVETAAELS